MGLKRIHPDVHSTGIFFVHSQIDIAVYFGVRGNSQVYLGLCSGSKCPMA